MRSSTKTDYLRNNGLKEPAFEFKVYGTVSPPSQSQMINRQLIKKLDSMKNQPPLNPISAITFANQGRNEAGTQSMNASYRQRM